MSDDRLKMPPVRDFGFYQRRKHDAWREVEPPTLEAPVADSHAHVHMLPDPAWELARCAVNGVDLACTVYDPSEDGPLLPDSLDGWLAECVCDLDKYNEEKCTALLPPTVRIAVGVHPHNARLYDATLEDALSRHLADPRVAVLGEIGLDYYYDLSPRDVQCDVFRKQVRLAKQFELPIALHLRDGRDEQADTAHAEAFDILQEEGFPEKGTLLHCCALPSEELAPWIEAGCHVAYGGALTFKNGDAARAGAAMVPLNRLLVETDAPYMAPEPMRGTACTPAHVVFSAARLAEVRGVSAGEERKIFLQQLHANTCAFLGIDLHDERGATE